MCWACLHRAASLLGVLSACEHIKNSDILQKGNLDSSVSGFISVSTTETVLPHAVVEYTYSVNSYTELWPSRAQYLCLLGMYHIIDVGALPS